MRPMPQHGSEVPHPRAVVSGVLAIAVEGIDRPRTGRKRAERIAHALLGNSGVGSRAEVTEERPFSPKPT